MILSIIVLVCFITSVDGFREPGYPLSHDRKIIGSNLKPLRGPLFMSQSESKIEKSSNLNEVNEDICYNKRKELLEAIDTYSLNKKASWNAEDTETAGKEKKQKKQKLGNKMIEINEEGKKVIELIENFKQYNPTEIPVAGFLGYKHAESPPQPFGSFDMSAKPNLGGMWKLRFTTAIDATFKPGKMGPVTTKQYVNATLGTFTNVIEFKENPGKTRGFQVVVEGRPTNDTRIDLTFKRVIIDRTSKIGLNRIVIPLPNFSFFSNIKKFFTRIAQRFIRVLSLFARNNDKQNKEENVKEKERNEGPYFNMLYLDDEMRIHKTGDGNYFVQTRLYDAWDPMIGWTLISAT